MARAPPGEGEAPLLPGEREGGRGERRGNSESGFQELKMREPALRGRGQGGLLRSEEREGAQPGAKRALKGRASPQSWPSGRAMQRVPPVWTLPMVGQDGARFCPCSVLFLFLSLVCDPTPGSQEE